MAASITDFVCVLQLDSSYLPVLCQGRKITCLSPALEPRPGIPLAVARLFASQHHLFCHEDIFHPRRPITALKQEGREWHLFRLTHDKREPVSWEGHPVILGKKEEVLAAGRILSGMKGLKSDFLSDLQL